MSQTFTDHRTPTDKVTCRCGMTAKCYRGCKRVEGLVMNYAKCPRCGAENLLGEWTKPAKKGASA